MLRSILLLATLTGITQMLAPGQGDDPFLRGSSPPPKSEKLSGARPTLREAAAARGIPIGASVIAGELGTPDPLATDSKYSALLRTQFDMAEPENAMKWGIIHPAQAIYNYRPADEIVRFAEANGMAVRGHTLVWNSANPEWLNAYARSASPAQMADLLKDHISNVVSHYAGKVFAWDVVNEALSDQQPRSGVAFKDSIWYNRPGIGASGAGYIAQAFKLAHAADPNALLCYNDYGIEGPGPKFDALLTMLKQLIVEGVPIGCVGFQTHADIFGSITAEGLEANIAAVAALGLQAQLTEVDVAVPLDAQGHATSSDLAAQAKEYGAIASACLESPACTAFQLWGVDNAYSWIPKAFPGRGDALPFDSSGKPTEAFTALLSAFESAPSVARSAGPRQMRPAAEKPRPPTQ